jgi:hypothetical protein
MEGNGSEILGLRMEGLLETYVGHDPVELCLCGPAIDEDATWR